MHNVVHLAYSIVNYDARMSMLPVEPSNYVDISEKVRSFCAERYFALEKSLRPLVDGTFGEILPGHLAAYLAAVRQLGKLYQAEKPPVDLQQLVPMAKVAEVIAGIREEHARELAAAVAAAEERVRMEVSAGSKVTVQAAEEAVLTRLLELESRGSQEAMKPV